MKQHVTICAALHIAFSLMGIIAGLIVWVTIAGGGLLSGEWEAIAITSGVAIAITSFLFILSIPGLIGGLALLKGYNWARILVLVIGCIDLMNIPFGTMLGVYTIWVLTNDETVRLFTAGSGATPTGT